MTKEQENVLRDILTFLNNLVKHGQNVKLKDDNHIINLCSIGHYAKYHRDSILILLERR